MWWQFVVTAVIAGSAGILVGFYAGWSFKEWARDPNEDEEDDEMQEVRALLRNS
jgi:hypothetical protein